MAKCGKVSLPNGVEAFIVFDEYDRLRFIRSSDTSVHVTDTLRVGSILADVKNEFPNCSERQLIGYGTVLELSPTIKVGFDEIRWDLIPQSMVSWVDYGSGP